MVHIKTSEDINILSIGNKIYYIDYEESGVSYTIEGIFKAKDNPVMKDGLYYNVHSDKLPIEIGRYIVAANDVDIENGRFFSSANKASDAYKKHISNNKITYDEVDSGDIER